MIIRLVYDYSGRMVASGDRIVSAGHRFTIRERTLFLAISYDHVWQREK